MQKIELDFSDCKFLGEIHKVMKKAFDFPDYYGENLSALWDLLDGYTDEQLHIHIIGWENLPQEFSDYKAKMLNIFSRVTKHNPNITFEVLS